jgi:multiple antibiotic resistance protein
LVCFGFADRLAQILGATGITVITQFSSFFLVCIGVQIAWNGTKALPESVSLHTGSQKDFTGLVSAGISRKQANDRQ